MSSSRFDVSSWPDHAVVFEIWGDYACFRRFYTTRSPLTFPVPPRPALAGMLGSIVGTDKGQVARVFAGEMARLSVALVAPLKTIRLGINWVDTKEPSALRVGLVSQRTQINIEFLKEPRFRVYALLKDERLRADLSHMLREHSSVYTPCLGMSEMLADFAWLGDWEAEPLGAGVIDVATALPVAAVVWPEEGQGVAFEDGQHYDRKKVPRVLDDDRAVLEWQDILVETSAKTIRAHVAEGWRVGNDHLVWL
ncbi:MAG: type I-B CRISPR-associated protein Cas5 [Chloroflexi bacterium]|nr:type I-B CRISPR-associated protein Cas5 [Chloroflexota bacterium]